MASASEARSVGRWNRRTIRGAGAVRVAVWESNSCPTRRETEEAQSDPFNLFGDDIVVENAKPESLFFGLKIFLSKCPITSGMLVF